MSSSRNRTSLLRLGTRRSKLAMVQAKWVAEAVSMTTGQSVRLAPMSSAGDESHAPIAAFGSTGVFVTALRDALLRGEVDFVVHSFKDLPTAPDPRLHLAAVPVREDQRDALVWKDGQILPAQLPPGTRIGTGSPRRAAQLLAIAPEVHVVPVRGNVDSRLKKISNRELDGVVLAMAGLIRLNLVDASVVPLSPVELVPAPGQGALAVECRADDPVTKKILSTIDDLSSRRLVCAERAVLHALDAGCTAPVGAYAEMIPGSDGCPQLRVEGLVSTVDGSTILRRYAIGDPAEPESLGREVTRALLHAGAAALLEALVAADDPRNPPLITQPQ
jgi:hydroxymethylbilane synthase